MQTPKTLKPVAHLSNLPAQVNPQSLIEYFFWDTYQDCARASDDPKQASINDLVLVVKHEPSLVAQILYRLGYAIFTYAITNEPDYLEETVQKCCTELENLQADYSLLQISKYLNKYTARQYSVVSSD